MQLLLEMGIQCFHCMITTVQMSICKDGICAVHLLCNVTMELSAQTWSFRPQPASSAGA